MSVFLQAVKTPLDISVFSLSYNILTPFIRGSLFFSKETLFRFISASLPINLLVFVFIKADSINNLLLFESLNETFLIFKILFLIL